jgi:hypothetical protein
MPLPNGLVRVRMRRTVIGYRQAVDLQMHEVYELLPEVAEQFIEMGTAEPEGKRSKLEAAALSVAERRG